MHLAGKIRMHLSFWQVKRVQTALVAAFTLIVFFQPVMSIAQSSGGSGLPLPRFVSLKSERVNMRIGPGREFQVVWLYLKKGLPIEVIQEYENWRKVRDPQGAEGWILHSLLSGKRTIIVNPGELENLDNVSEMRAKASADSELIARLQPGVVADIEGCSDDWCRVSVDGLEGYIEKKQVWGVYPDELIEG